MLGSLVEPFRQQTSRFFLFVIALLLIFGTMSYWSGLPTAVSFPFFLMGTVLFLAIFFAFTLLAWHLLIRPLPQSYIVNQPDPLTAQQRYIIAWLFALAIVMIQIGGIWDEAWHRQYGVAFGDDLFWRPHQLIYAGFATYVFSGFWGLYKMVTHCRGTLQQRFRANPLLGGLALLGGFLLYALPADPLWHLVYGEDITAWSLPHLVLLFNMMVTLFLAIGFYATVFSTSRWRILHLHRDTLFTVFTAGVGLMGMLQILTTEWDALFTGPVAPDPLSYWNRPDWILPVMIMAVCAALGVFVIRVTRMAGAATLMTLVTLAVRLGMIELLQFDLLRAYPLYLMLGPMLLLDGWYALQVSKFGVPREAVQLDGLVIFIGGWLFTLPLIDRFYTYPIVDGRLLLLTFLFGLPFVMLCILAGYSAAKAIRDLPPSNQPSSQRHGHLPQLKRAAAWLLLGIFGFLLVFILTATSPV